MGENQRKKERIQSQNLLYLCVKENDDIIQQGMGKTLDVSESGIRLETNFPIDSKKTVTLSIGFEEDIVDIKGKIVYYIEKKGTYEYGIRFEHVDETAFVILNQYVRMFKNENDG